MNITNDPKPYNATDIAAIAEFLKKNPTRWYKITSSSAFMWCTKHEELVHVSGNFSSKNADEREAEYNRLRELLNRL